MSKDKSGSWFKRHKILTAVAAIIVAVILYHWLKLWGLAVLAVAQFVLWKYAAWPQKVRVWASLGISVVLIVIASAWNNYNLPPTISIDNALADSIGTSNNVSNYDITGNITSQKSVTLTIDGKHISLNSHHDFSYKTGLHDGDNNFTLIATNGSGEDREVLTIHRNTKAEDTQDAAQPAAADKAAKQQAAADAASQKAAQQQSDENAIKTAVKKDLGGSNDVGGGYYRSIDVEPQVSGGYGVFVDYNADEASNNKDDKVLYTEKAEQLYKTIYSQTGQDIKTASVSAWFAGTDQYGNNSDKLVYKTMLDKSVADKVNWKADDATLQIDLPNLWSVTQDFLQ
jgi:hypothetical protein